MSGRFIRLKEYKLYPLLKQVLLIEDDPSIFYLVEPRLPNLPDILTAMSLSIDGLELFKHGPLRVYPGYPTARFRRSASMPGN